MTMEDYEKLGAFYLGRPYDLKEKQPKDGILLYDSKDLVTHAVCVGMTGSGKTGLCIALLEEAAIDGIPAIIIDPKGDLTNLLLTFPNLNPQDFAPWVNEEDAQKKNLSPADYAAQQADLWKKGLASWGQDGARIKRLRDAADFRIYTPGSNAGIPVSILKSFAAPPATIREDAELMAERVNTTGTSLLGLVGIAADPLKSREHILISNILNRAWSAGSDLDIAGLIQQIQSPPMKTVGVMDIDSFFPPKDRFELAMSLNSLLAAPGFSNWMEGDALDIQQMLHTPEGKPRLSIFSIAHLNDAERMFFVSLLLNQTLGWMRTQSGTTSLRAILYMDEIFGYFPPTANPPSKVPLLTLLKQGRAFGLGVVLVTQNPVDLDYKGLSNAGTWFIGRLQTERDKARVLEGLEGIAGGTGMKFDRNAMEQTLAGLGNRIFLLNNVHEDGTEVFETRWDMSYLRGPLTRSQIKSLMDPVKAQSVAAAPPQVAAVAAGATTQSASNVVPATADAAGVGAKPEATSQRPTLPPGISQYFIPVRGRASEGSSLTYHPALIGFAEIGYSDSKTINFSQQLTLMAPITDDQFPSIGNRVPQSICLWKIWKTRLKKPHSLRNSPAQPPSPGVTIHGRRSLQPGSTGAKNSIYWKAPASTLLLTPASRSATSEYVCSNTLASDATRQLKSSDRSTLPGSPRWRRKNAEPNKQSSARQSRLKGQKCKLQFRLALRCCLLSWAGSRLACLRWAGQPPPRAVLAVQ